MTDIVKHYRQLLGIAKTWAEQHLPDWCDDMHRHLIAKHGAVVINGRLTASSMSLPQLAAALEDYERRGWVRQRGFVDAQAKRTGEAKPKPVPPRIANIFKLWGKLGKAGKVDHATRANLLKFCGRQTARSIRSLDDLSPQECVVVTESLKGWLSR